MFIICVTLCNSIWHRLLFSSSARSITLESTNRRNWLSLRTSQSSWWKLSVRSSPTWLCPSRRRYCSNHGNTLIAFDFLTGFYSLCFAFLSLLSYYFLPPTQSSIPLLSRSKKTKRRSVWSGGCWMSSTRCSWTRTPSTTAWPTTWRTACSVRATRITPACRSGNRSGEKHSSKLISFLAFFIPHTLF